MKPIKRSKLYLRGAASTSQHEDLYSDFQLRDLIVAGIQLFLVGKMTSTGGGAVTGFRREAPWSLIQNLVMEGRHKVLGRNHQLVNQPPQQLWLPSQYEEGYESTLLRTSSGAASTDPFRGQMQIPFRDRNFRAAEATYLDGRLLTDFNMRIDWAADSELADTNLDSLSEVGLEIQMDLVKDGPAPNKSHFAPQLVYKEMDGSSDTTKQVDQNQNTVDGLLTASWLQSFDDSKVGDNERTDALFRRLTISHNNINVVDTEDWVARQEKTRKLYPLAGSTTRHKGIVGIPFVPPLNMGRGPAFIERDTKSALSVGAEDAAVTPASGDKLFATHLGAVPINF